MINTDSREATWARTGTDITKATCIEDRWLIIDGKKVLYVLSDGIAVKEGIASKCNLKYKLCKYNHGFRAKIKSINEGNISKILMAVLQSN